MPHPAMLRGLVEQYDDLRAEHIRNSTAGTRRELEDLTYTLCVSTGTLTIEAALTAAHNQLNTALTDLPAKGDAASHPTQLTA